MANIFENAKFGDKFRTRNGRMAIYSRYKYHNHCHEVLIEAGLYDYNEDGSLCDFKGTSPWDIIPKWKRMASFKAIYRKIKGL